MTEHVHKWKIVKSTADPSAVWIECNDDCPIGLMENDEAERRLNATERLSAELIREELGSYGADWTGWDKVRRAAWEYARELEGE